MKFRNNLVVVCAFLLTANGVLFADNPIIPGQGICDPHIRIFNNRAYLFASHDTSRGNPIYTMEDWWLWSSDDLVNWTHEFTLRPEDTYIGGPFTSCYAPDGHSRNGKYYFYFSQGQSQTGVAVSDAPGGPYVDALGAPLLPADLTSTADYDCSIFIDDDNTPYIVWGFTVIGEDYYIARLKDNMIELDEEPRVIDFGGGWKNDAPALHKHNGIYYLNAHQAEYATSTNVYGPYTDRGQFKSTWTDHGSIFLWNNQAFHVYGIQDGDPYFRTTLMQYAHYKDNGDIAVDQFIADSPLGVGQYDSTWAEIQAEWYFAASAGTEKRENADGFEVRVSEDGAYLAFPKIQNLPTNASLYFRVASTNTVGCTIEVREGSPSGTLLGSADVLQTGSSSTYQTVKAVLNNSAGTKDIYLVFKGGGDELVRLDWFKTNISLVLLRYEAEQASLSGGCGVNNNHSGYSGTGFVDGYAQNQGATTTFTVDGGNSGMRAIKLGYSASGNRSVGIYVNGTKVKDMSLSGTANWQTWGEKIETISMPAGPFELSFVAESAAVWVNIDYVDIETSPNPGEGLRNNLSLGIQ